MFRKDAHTPRPKSYSTPLMIPIPPTGAYHIVGQIKLLCHAGHLSQLRRLKQRHKEVIQCKFVGGGLKVWEERKSRVN